MPNIFSFMYRGIKTTKEERSKGKNKFCHGYGSKISVVWSQKKYLSPGSSEWRCGEGRRGPALCSWLVREEKIGEGSLQPK
jgi:hypothetical protein